MLPGHPAPSSRLRQLVSRALLAVVLLLQLDALDLSLLPPAFRSRKNSYMVVAPWKQ
jgi:hypothetical protein